jgi:SSS family solute:Na+ symporter
VIICIAIYAFIPNLFSSLDWARTNEVFLQETHPKTVYVEVAALNEDVAVGRADRIGQIITRQHVIEPKGIFFENVARVDPSNPDSSKMGFGRFHAELWVMSWFGIDFRGFSKAWLVALRFFFDAFFPFLLLFLFSFFTKPVPEKDLDRFFAKMHTPVQATPEKEQEALEASYKNPGKFKTDKLFPNSNWEIMKPSRHDFLGFFGSWVLVGVIILLLWLMVSIR